MIDQNTIQLLSDLSFSMFSKNFFGIYHGSLSAKLDQNNFMINTKMLFFDNIDEKRVCRLNMNKQDFRWNNC